MIAHRTGLLCTLLFALSGCAMEAKPGAEFAPGVARGASLAFEIRHEFTIDVPDAATRLDAWLPMPSPNDQFQDVTQWIVDEGRLETEVIEDNWGNAFLHVFRDDPDAGVNTVTTTFRLTRFEEIAELDPEGTRGHTLAEQTELAPWTAPTAMTVSDPEIKAMAAEAVGAEPNPIRAARKLYDTVIERVEHAAKDPNPDSARVLHATGRGSSQLCFTSGSGDDVDIHALYAAAARSIGLPCRIVFGSRLKPDLAGKDVDQGVHTWVEINVPNVGWIPLDLALADLYAPGFDPNAVARERAEQVLGETYTGPDPSRVDFYFGHVDARRVSWHWGRDLDVGQFEAPLLSNATGYVEVDGIPTEVRRKLTYVELDESPPTSE
ncbi:MAG: transglutaminase domain-containing protein [Planctomycetes bacterium]|nr:transglutaminase domain-containing protein [Planctomycetota bacterium]